MAEGHRIGVECRRYGASPRDRWLGANPTEAANLRATARSRNRAPVADDVPLALRVLRRLASPLEPVLLALLHARVAREEASLAERRSVGVGVDLEQRPGDAMADRAGLAGHTAALDLDHRVEPALGPGDPEGHADLGLVDGVA